MGFPNIDLGDGNIYSLTPYYIWAARVPQTDVTITLTNEEAGRHRPLDPRRAQNMPSSPSCYSPKHPAWGDLPPKAGRRREHTVRQL